MAAIFRKDWEIKPVLETLLRSAHFFDSENIGAMYKSPASFLIGSIRSMNISKVPDFRMDVSSVTNRDLSNRMTSLGEILFNPPNVKVGQVDVHGSALQPFHFVINSCWM